MTDVERLNEQRGKLRERHQRYKEVVALDGLVDAIHLCKSRGWDNTARELDSLFQRVERLIDGEDTLADELDSRVEDVLDGVAADADDIESAFQGDGSIERRVTETEVGETHWFDTSFLDEQLDLPGEPIQVDLAGRNVGFVVPTSDGDE